MFDVYPDHFTFDVYEALIVEGDESILQPNVLKFCSFAFGALQAGVTLMGPPETIHPAKTLTLTVQTLNLLSLGPRAILDREKRALLQRVTVSEFILATKMTINLFAYPLKLLIALDNYSIVARRISSFLTPEIRNSLLLMSWHATQFVSVVTVLETLHHLTVPKIDKLGLAFSVSKIGSLVASYFGYTPLLMSTQVVSNALGAAIVWKSLF